MNNKWEFHFLRKTKRAKSFRLWLVQARVTIGTCSLTGEFFFSVGFKQITKNHSTEFLGFQCDYEAHVRNLNGTFCWKRHATRSCYIRRFRAKAECQRSFIHLELSLTQWLQHGDCSLRQVLFFLISFYLVFLLPLVFLFSILTRSWCLYYQELVWSMTTRNSVGDCYDLLFKASHVQSYI